MAKKYVSAKFLSLFLMNSKSQLIRKNTISLNDNFKPIPKIK